MRGGTIAARRMQLFLGGAKGRRGLATRRQEIFDKGRHTMKRTMETGKKKTSSEKAGV